MSYYTAPLDMRSFAQQVKGIVMPIAIMQEMDGYFLVSPFN